MSLVRASPLDEKEHGESAVIETSGAEWHAESSEDETLNAAAEGGPSSEADRNIRGLVVDRVTSTSVRLQWEAPDTSFRIDGVRIGQRLKQRISAPFTTIETYTKGGEQRTYTAVHLLPDTEYEFQVISLHDVRREGKVKTMIVDGTKLISSPVRTAKALYVRAWFFENPEEVERQWAVYFGHFSSRTADATKFFGAMTVDQLSEAQALKIGQTDSGTCLTGQRCMFFEVPAGLESGCCVDVSPLQNARRYRAEVYIWIDSVGDGRVSLGAWDYEAGYWASDNSQSEQLRECRWGKLETSFVAGPLGRVKLSIQCSAEYAGLMLVDACRVFLLSRDAVGEAAHALERDAAAPRPNYRGLLSISLLEAVNLPRFSLAKPPFVAALATVVEDESVDEKHRAKFAADSAAPRPNSRGRTGSRPAACRFVMRWRDNVVAETGRIETKKDDLLDLARPSWISDDEYGRSNAASCSINLRDAVKADKSPEAVTSLLEETVEIELIDASFQGRQARAKRKGFQAAMAKLQPKEAAALGDVQNTNENSLPTSRQLAACSLQASEVIAQREAAIFGEGLQVKAAPISLSPIGHRRTLRQTDTSATGSMKRLLLTSASSRQIALPQLKKASASEEGLRADEVDGAPVARLLISIRELLAAPAYRGWYRLENEDGATQACVALMVRSWDPVDEDRLASETHRELKSALITHLASELGDSGLGSIERSHHLKQMLRLLGAKGSASAGLAGTSSPLKLTRRKAQSGQLQPTVDPRDPTEAQARLDPTILLKRKRAMVRQGVIEECAASLHDPACVEVAAALLVALCTFPATLVSTSADVSRCCAELQRSARLTGVLDFAEEATDAYAPSLQAYGGSSNSLSNVSAVEPFTDKQRALAAAIAAAGAPSAPPSIATAAALLAAVCSSRRVLVEVLDHRPSLFPVLARAVADGVSPAVDCLTMLNLASSLPPAILDQYREHRVIVPASPAFWRCPSLADDVNFDDDLRLLCRRARQRARAAGRHRQATGAFPRRVRVSARPFTSPLRLSGDAAEFARLSIAGGPAFWKSDADRDDRDLVAVAFDEISTNVLQVKTAEPQADRRLRTQGRLMSLEQRRQLRESRRGIAETAMTRAEERPAFRNEILSGDKQDDEYVIADDDLTELFDTSDDSTMQLHTIGEADENDSASVD